MSPMAAGHRPTHVKFRKMMQAEENRTDPIPRFKKVAVQREEQCGAAFDSVVRQTCQISWSTTKEPPVNVAELV